LEINVKTPKRYPQINTKELKKEFWARKNGKK
jgi:hypothetical protein